jgi:hypothetical protein
LGHPPTLLFLLIKLLLMVVKERGGIHNTGKLGEKGIKGK